jgi:hypothetical protein
MTCLSTRSGGGLQLREITTRLELRMPRHPAQLDSISTHNLRSLSLQLVVLISAAFLPAL